MRLGMHPYSRSMHAAYVLLSALHTCRFCMCAAHDYMPAACVQEGTNWACVHQDVSTYMQHTSCTYGDMCHLHAAR